MNDNTEPSPEDIEQVASEIVEQSLTKFFGVTAQAQSAIGETRERIRILNEILRTKRVWARLRNLRGREAEVNERVAILRNAIAHSGSLMFAPQIMKVDRSGFLWDDRTWTRRYRNLSELEIVILPAPNHAGRIVVPDERLGELLRGKELPTNCI